MCCEEVCGGLRWMTRVGSCLGSQLRQRETSHPGSLNYRKPLQTMANNCKP
jgi:hypothetical protein